MKAARSCQLIVCVVCSDVFELLEAVSPTHEEGTGAYFNKYELVAIRDEECGLAHGLDVDGDGKIHLKEWMSFLRRTVEEKGGLEGQEWIISLLHTLRMSHEAFMARVESQGWEQEARWERWCKPAGF